MTKTLPVSTPTPGLGDKSLIINYTGTYIPTCIWTNIEVHVGIVSASVPALWPLLRALATGHLRGGTSQHGQSRGHSAAELNRSSRNGNRNASRQYSNRRKIADDDEGFVHLADISSDSQNINKSTEIRIAEVETGPPVPAKAHVGPGRSQGWRE